MAINQNHSFEDLDGIKCAIVEKNADQQRVDFLKSLLEFNNFTVVVVPSPPPKVAPAPAGTPPTAAPAAAPTEGTPPPQPAPPTAPPPPAGPTTFTVGVTDVMFNPTNAIFGRLLRTRDGKVVTLAYWQQKDSVSKDDTPYFSGQ